MIRELTWHLGENYPAVAMGCFDSAGFNMSGEASVGNITLFSYLAFLPTNRG